MVPVRWKEGKERGRAWPRAEVVKLLVGEMAAFLAGSLRAQSDRSQEGEHQVFGFIWDTGSSTLSHMHRGLPGAPSLGGDCREHAVQSWEWLQSSVWPP